MKSVAFFYATLLSIFGVHFFKIALKKMQKFKKIWKIFFEKFLCFYANKRICFEERNNSYGIFIDIVINQNVTVNFYGSECFFAYVLNNLKDDL